MAALEQYTNAIVYAEGAVLAETSDVSFKRVTNAQPVNTILKGFAGMSPGARICNVSIKNAVPRAGMEFDPGPWMKATSPIELSIFVAGKVATFKAFPTDDTFQYAVNSNGSLDIEFVGTFPEWH